MKGYLLAPAILLAANGYGSMTSRQGSDPQSSLLNKPSRRLLERIRKDEARAIRKLKGRPSHGVHADPVVYDLWANTCSDPGDPTEQSTRWYCAMSATRQIGDLTSLQQFGSITRPDRLNGDVLRTWLFNGQYDPYVGPFVAKTTDTNFITASGLVPRQVGVPVKYDYIAVGGDAASANVGIIYHALEGDVPPPTNKVHIYICVCNVEEQPSKIVALWNGSPIVPTSSGGVGSVGADGLVTLTGANLYDVGGYVVYSLDEPFTALCSLSIFVTNQGLTGSGNHGVVVTGFVAQ